MSDNLEQRIQTLQANIRVALSPLDGNPVSEKFTASVLRDVLAEVVKGECRRDNVVVTDDLRFAQDVTRAISNLDTRCTCIVCIARKVKGEQSVKSTGHK